MDKFLEYLDDYWYANRRDMWAAYTRVDLPQWRSHRHNTTNLIENHFLHQKYTYARCRRLSSLRKHIRLLHKVVETHRKRRETNLKGLSESNKQKIAESLDRQKDWLLSDQRSEDGYLPLLFYLTEIPFSGAARSQRDGKKELEFYLGDLSCACDAGKEQQLCIHLEAAAEKLKMDRGITALTTDHIRACGEYIYNKGTVKEAPEDWYECPVLAQGNGRVTKCTVYTAKGKEYCTCPVFCLAGNCPHLWACLLHAHKHHGREPGDLVEQDVDLCKVEAFRLDLSKIQMDEFQDGQVHCYG